MQGKAEARGEREGEARERGTDRPTETLPRPPDRGAFFFRGDCPPRV